MAGELAAVAEGRNIAITTAVDRRTPPVLANRAALRRVLLILIDNALKYSNDGGSIEVTATPRPAGATLAVRDTGQGIALEDIPHVFDRFYRADKSRTGANGAGLGLSIAQTIARMHGTQIQVESAPGSGSRFLIALSSNLQKKGVD